MRHRSSQLPTTIWDVSYPSHVRVRYAQDTLLDQRASSCLPHFSSMPAAAWLGRPLGGPGSQLTIRALAIGLGVGTLLCCSNMYFGLQTGWVTMGSLQSAILGYGIFRLWGTYMHLIPSFSIGENVIVQTTAVATATMPLAAGLVGIIPAFSIMSPEDNPPNGPLKFSPGQLLLWSTALAFFGVFMAVPLRQQTIIREKLKFPSGTATASVIATLHGATMREEGVHPKQGWRRVGQEDVTAAADMQVALEEGQAADPSTTFLPQSHHSSTGSSSTALNRGGPPAAALRVASSRGSSRSSLGLGSEADREVAAAVAVVADFQKAWKALLVSFAGSFGYSLLAAGVPMFRHLQIFSWVGWSAATAWGWEMTMSMGYVGQGMIMGPRTCWSMLAGAVTGFAILGPIAKAKGWAPGAIGDWESGATGWVMWVSLAVMMGDSLTSLGLVTYTSLRQQWRRRARQGPGYQPMALDRDGQTRRMKVSDFGEEPPNPEKQQVRNWDEDGDDRAGSLSPPPPAFLAPGDEVGDAGGDTGVSDVFPGNSGSSGRGGDAVPTAWWVGGLAASWVLCTAILVPLLQLPLYEPLVALLLAGLVALLAVRALGQTDLNPVSGVGKLSQLVFALVSPGRVVPNLVAGAIAEAGAQQAGDMMQDFKTAHLLGVSPVDQFWAMLLGSAASVLVSVAAFVLYTSVWEVPGKEFPAPTSRIWLDMAKLVNGGNLPQNVAPFCISFGLLAAALPVLEHWLHGLVSAQRHAGSPDTAGAAAAMGGGGGSRRALAAAVAGKLLAMCPSGIGFAVGMYIAPKWTLPRVLGCVVERAWHRWSPGSHQQLMMVLASGLVLGEGTASIFTAIAHSIFVRS